MKTILSALFAAALFASPAAACNWMKTADGETVHTAELSEKSEEAITTFDPAEKPVFEEAAEAADTQELVEEKAE
ncbi:MAG: hypothetical protein OXR62_07390 [Ahrensia sp.]|nr:hypothetical protein [Ahrensia sp.]